MHKYLLIPFIIFLFTGTTFNKTYIHVDKSERSMQWIVNGKVVKTYPIVLGLAPVGDKEKEGDRKTPEGWFKVKAKYPHKSWTKFIWFDYPNKVSQQKFEQRKAEGKIEKTATIGGDVGIHGVPDEDDSIIDQKIDWTWGCISMKTKDINDLYQKVQVGTEIYIEP